MLEPCFRQFGPDGNIFIFQVQRISVSAVGEKVHFSGDTGAFQSKIPEKSALNSDAVVLSLDNKGGGHCAVNGELLHDAALIIHQVGRIHQHGKVGHKGKFIPLIGGRVGDPCAGGGKRGSEVSSCGKADTAHFGHIEKFPVRPDHTHGTGAVGEGCFTAFGAAVLEKKSVDPNGVEPVADGDTFMLPRQISVAASGGNDNGGTGIGTSDREIGHCGDSDVRQAVEAAAFEIVEVLNECFILRNADRCFPFPETELFITQQQTVFRMQLELAHRLSLPVIIHSRESTELIINILKDCKHLDLRGVFHAYSGSGETFRELRKLGDWYIGIGGVLTYKKASIAETVKSIPLERILLETDSPYLTPVPFRGKETKAAISLT